MSGTIIALVIFAAAAAGFGVAWLLASARTRDALRNEYDARLTEMGSQRAAAERAAEELRRQLESAKLEMSAERTAKEEEQKRRVAAETSLQEIEKGVAEQRKLLEEAAARMKDAFKALAADTLTDAQKQFLNLAHTNFTKIQAEAAGELGKREEAVRGIVDPLNKSLEKLKEEIAQVESSRQRAYGDLTRQVEDLKKETGSLVTSLRQPQVKGRWGELTLRRAVELAGMAAHCDFEEQESIQTDEGRLRPDLTVYLPGGRQIVVDAKAPLHAFLKMDTVQTNEEFHKILEEHARLVRGHVEKLSGRAYWSQLPASTDFVVLFLPGENFFSGALQKDSTLIADAIDKKVILASPTTLIALLRAIAYGWRQEKVAENAARISELGKELHDKIRVFIEHLNKIGTSLDAANRAYNSAVGSLEQRLIPGAKKFKELGVQSAAEIPDAEPTEVALRQLTAGEE
jgi:DNA recombination protein RmuC